MKRLTKSLLAIAVAAAVLPGVANAGVDWQFNYAHAFLADGATRPANTPALSPITDELKFTAESVVTFDDKDGSNSISAGDTFKDYIFVRIDQLFRNSSDVTDDRYGNGAPGLNAPGNHEITVKLLATGVQLDAINYLVTGISFMDWYFDAGTDVVDGQGVVTVSGYTQADFGNLGTFTDGTIVETSDLISGAGTNSPLVPDGNIDIKVWMNDVLHTLGDYNDFELFGPRLTGLDFVMGISDSNNDRCEDSGGTTECASSIASILTAFNATEDDLTFHTKSDGSFIKEIPEPATLALLSIGLLGAGAIGARRRKQIA